MLVYLCVMSQLEGFFLLFLHSLQLFPLEDKKKKKKIGQDKLAVRDTMNILILVLTLNVTLQQVDVYL